MENIEESQVCIFHIISLFSLLFCTIFSISFHNFLPYFPNLFSIRVAKIDKLNSEMIWKIWKKNKLNSEKIGKMGKKSWLNYEFSISVHYFLLYIPYHFIIQSTFFYHIFHIFSQFSSIFSISFHYST
jgi:hypothetical protein